MMGRKMMMMDKEKKEKYQAVISLESFEFGLQNVLQAAMSFPARSDAAFGHQF